MIKNDGIVKRNESLSQFSLLVSNLIIFVLELFFFHSSYLLYSSKHSLLSFTNTLRLLLHQKNLAF